MILAKRRLILAGVIVFAVFLGFGTWRRFECWRQKEIAVLQHRIDLDDSTYQSPVDLGRYENLMELFHRAQKANYADGVRRLRQKLKRAPGPNMQRSWLSRDSTRFAVLSDPSTNIIWIGYAARIEGRDGKTGALVRTVDLTDLQVVPYQAVSLFGEPRTNATSRSRNPAQLGQLFTASAVNAVIAVISYPAKDIQADMDTGSTEQSGEQEALIIRPDMGYAESLGIVTNHEFDRVWQKLEEVSEGEARRTRAAMRASGKVEQMVSIARDPENRGMLLAVELLVTDEREQGETEAAHAFTIGFLSSKAEFHSLVTCDTIFFEAGGE